MGNLLEKGGGGGCAVDTRQQRNHTLKQPKSANFVGTVKLSVSRQACWALFAHLHVQATCFDMNLLIISKF